jgi:hypothetical protein
MCYLFLNLFSVIQYTTIHLQNSNTLQFTSLFYRVSDNDLLNAWQGCETVMSNCLARFAQLNAALEKPSSDLGPVGLDKCRGFSLHLMVS